MSFGPKKKPSGMTGGKPRPKAKKAAKKRRQRPASKRLWELCKQLTRTKYGNTCYTCGATGLVGSNWHTGHFIPKSICSTELAYSLDNLRPQCNRCNIRLSGNWPAFEDGLRRDCGPDYPELLKRRNQETKGLSYGTPWLEAKIVEYGALLDAS